MHSEGLPTKKLREAKQDVVQMLGNRHPIKVRTAVTIKRVALQQKETTATNVLHRKDRCKHHNVSRLTIEAPITKAEVILVPVQVILLQITETEQARKGKRFLQMEMFRVLLQKATEMLEEVRQELKTEIVAEAGRKAVLPLQMITAAEALVEQ